MSRIVIPLDGSELAESAIAWSAPVARALGDSVHLVAVHPLDEELWEFAGIDASAPLARVRESLSQYLDEVARREDLAGLEVTHQVAAGEVVPKIHEAASDAGTRLVALTTRGRGGMREEGGAGSVSMRLIRMLAAPLLVVPPRGIAPGIRGMLAALDGSDDAARSLPLARDLRSALGVPLHLVEVVNVDQGWGLLEAEHAALTGARVRRAREELAATAQEGEVTSVEQGPVLDGLLDYARDHDLQLIVMATHGRSGRARLDLGSTADAMVRASDRPLLLTPIREQ